jgi:ADP-heptose:LPS heptosyltransferase
MQFRLYLLRVKRPSEGNCPILQLEIQPGGLLIRTLLIRPGAIGDFIVSLPAMEALRTGYTEVWCAAQNVSLARFADAAHSIVGMGLNRVGLVPADDVIERLRRFDRVISWYGSNRPEFRELVSEAGLPFVFQAALPGPGIHAVDFYNRQARELGAPRPARFPEVRCPPATRSFAVIHPFASSPAKRAPMAVFERLAERLSGAMNVHWLRGPEEKLNGSRYVEDLYELATWLRQARVFVGNDSGISHLAAAVGTPVTVFFTSTDPGAWVPRGPAVNYISISSEQIQSWCLNIRGRIF